MIENLKLLLRGVKQDCWFHMHVHLIQENKILYTCTGLFLPMFFSSISTPFLQIIFPHLEFMQIQLVHVKVTLLNINTACFWKICWVLNLPTDNKKRPMGHITNINNSSLNFLIWKYMTKSMHNSFKSISELWLHVKHKSDKTSFDQLCCL